ncbi:nSTAND1 domain-containing NTPase [Crossiella sp. NPDC003009]
MAEATGFGAGLRRLRTERGLSLTQVAQLVHYSKGYLSNIENGRKPVNPGLARRLDEALAADGELTGLVGLDHPRCPYQGLAAFEAEDAGWFHGRERATAALLGRLAEARATGLPLVVFGVSGAGKSSLLRAGLVPVLGRGALLVDGPLRVLTPTATPMRVLPEPGGVLVVDQFEEVFTLCEDPDERREFITALCAAAKKGTLVVLGVRADFFGACLAQPQLLEAVRHNQFTVGAMCRQELVEAITGPARTAGLAVEPGLVELLLRDLGLAGEDPGAAYDPGALPLLSYALLGTWQQRSADALTVAGYRLTGGIEGAVAAAAERAYDQLGSEAQDAARRVLLRLVRIDERDEPARRRVQQAELLGGAAKPAQAAIETLVEARLLVLDRDTVEIAHEALLRAWPRLAEWIAADRAGLRLHRQLTQAAHEWACLGHDSGALYSGLRLSAAAQWAAEHDTELTEGERDFLRASAAAGQRRVRTRRRLTTLLVVLLVLASTATLVAARSRYLVAEQRDLALGRNAVASAITLQEQEPALAMQLRLAAYRRSPHPELADAVLAAFTSPYRGRFTGHTGEVVSVAYAPSGPVAATAGWDRTVRLWDIANPNRPVELAVLPLAAAAREVAFHPGGKLLATVDHGALRLWEIGDPRVPLPLSTVPAALNSVAFSPDGRSAATGGGDGLTRLWDLSDPRGPRETGALPGHSGPVTSVTFSRDGGLLATAGDHTARLWELGGTPRLRGQVSGHTATVPSVSISPDGATMATASWDHTVRLWRTADLRPLATLGEHKTIMWSVAFSKDGRRLATNGSGSTLLWEVTDPAAPRKVSTLPGGTYQVAFAPDGNTVATPQWIKDLRELPLTGHEDVVTTATFSPDGNLLATGSWDRTVRLWDARHPRPLAQLTGPGAFVRGVAFHPRDHLLAAASEDGSVWLWDLTNPAAPRALPPLAGDTGEITAVKFSHNGRVLAAVGLSAVTLWDVTGRRVLARFAETPYTNLATAFSPDDEVLTLWTTNTPVRQWRITDPARPVELPQPAGAAAANVGALSPDGRFMASYQPGDNTVRLRDQGGELAAISGLPVVYWLAFAPDGRRLVAGAEDGVVRVWDLSDPHVPVEQARLVGHQGPVPGVAVSPDGTRVVTTGNDRTVRLWDTDLERVAARICAVAHPRISRAEWEKHFPGMEFRPPC